MPQGTVPAWCLAGTSASRGAVEPRGVAPDPRGARDAAAKSAAQVEVEWALRTFAYPDGFLGPEAMVAAVGSKPA